MVQEPHREMQEIWGECEKSWEKINQEMKNIDLLEFGPQEDFSNLHDIVKQHEEKDLAWEAKISYISSKISGQVKKFMENLIKTLAILQRLSVRIIKYKRSSLVQEVFSAPMYQHRFPYANTCEDLFIKWSEYEKKNPLQ